MHGELGMVHEPPDGKIAPIADTVEPPKAHSTKYIRFLTGTGTVEVLFIDVVESGCPPGNLMATGNESPGEQSATPQARLFSREWKRFPHSH